MAGIPKVGLQVGADVGLTVGDTVGTIIEIQTNCNYKYNITKWLKYLSMALRR